MTSPRRSSWSAAGTSHWALWPTDCTINLKCFKRTKNPKEKRRQMESHSEFLKDCGGVGIISMAHPND